MIINKYAETLIIRLKIGACWRFLCAALIPSIALNLSIVRLRFKTQIQTQLQSHQQQQEQLQQQQQQRLRRVSDAI